MRRRKYHLILLAAAVATVASVSVAQTTVGGRNLAMRSSGSSSGSSWTLQNNGFVGTYIRLNEPGQVTLSVAAAGMAAGGEAPRMDLVVADHSMGWDVTGTTSSYQTTVNLPAGTYVVRTQLSNDVERSSRNLNVSSLTVTGAEVLNSNTDALALAAADSYITNFRRGRVRVEIPGATPGAQVSVALKNHEFNWGTAVAGGNFSNLMNVNPSPGSTAANYQQRLLQHFNAITPENAGKWAENEFTRDSPWSPQLDKTRAFAAANGLRMRGHNLIWGNQQPGWVNTLLSQAAGGNATAAAELRAEISERIDSYVGDGVGDDPARQYIELDVYNETIHTTQYWDVYGPAGVADIYREVQEAVEAAGASTRLATNEYNVLQDSGDLYGSWYRENIEDLLAEGAPVTAIGIQSYENDPTTTWTGGLHSASRKMQTLQNLSVLGLPMTLTEFGVKDPTTPADAQRILEETARLVFGTPQAEGFFQWGFWRGSIYHGAAALYDQNWNLTTVGQRWVDLMSVDSDADPNDDWSTQLTAVVGEDGAIEFDGFWGNYELGFAGQSYALTLEKGRTGYTLLTTPGDYNGDGLVDAADYSVWRDSLGSSSLVADGDGDGVVGPTDYAEWAQSYAMAAGTRSAAVPEPLSSVIVFGLLGVYAAAVRTRRLV